ncbi:MAG: hypothetical protein HXY40_07490 [Chloroflexi bacterium]|nr:hypothetical protein [Chloroflexota bacterium]
MTKLRLLPAVLLVVVLASCAPPPNLRDPNMLRDTSLLTSEPCAAPCWNGMTPGETLWRDARTIIEDQTGIADLQIQEQDGAVGATWRTIDGERACCQAVSTTGETLDYIQIQLAPDITLAALFEVRGEPAYVVVGAEFSADQSVLLLLYPDVPMIIYAFVAGAAEGALSATSEVIAVSYLKPDDMELIVNTNNLQAWDGYQTYSYYSDSEFEVTPIMTLTPTPGS